jgi:hypothetical protein
MVRLLGLATDVEQIDAHEDDEEAADERDGVDPASSVEALEQDSTRDDGGGREEDVVDRIDNVGGECVEGFVEVVLDET